MRRPRFAVGKAESLTVGQEMEDEGMAARARRQMGDWTRRRARLGARRMDGFISLHDNNNQKHGLMA